MHGLEGRVAVVTGGGGGIGHQICRRMSQGGAKVAVCDVNVDAATKTVKALEADGGTAGTYNIDITDLTGVQAAVRAVEGELGPIDILINNAGWDVFQPFLKTEPALWQKIINVNLTGALNMHYAVLPGMIERGGGRVVNVAYEAARVGSSGEKVSSTCKAGLVGLSKTLAREHARQGITFNVVCPGPTQTNLLQGVLDESSNPDKLAEAFRRAIPMGRLGQPEDLAGAVAFFASDEAAFVTGQVLSVSGGLTMSG
ncbi:MAG: SDR family NAD(P)-dependent oxidoreductase [Hyphomicrobiaceae bacterium]